MSGLRKRIGWVLPEQIKTAIKCLKVLEIDYGHTYSVKEKAAIDKQGNPIPWFTYPAITYLKQLNFSNKLVFEYGSGNSTLFWGARAERVISVEHQEQWYQKMEKIISKNTELKLIKDSSYPQAISKYDEDFDAIVIDGAGQYRYDCAVEAIKKLKSGGMIILDNSDWFVNTAKFLRESNLIQVDMSGFAPINSYTHTTSLFLSRDFDFKYNQQPQNIIGSIKCDRISVSGGDEPREALANKSYVKF
jgi:precorrin-6B methylase 2